MSCLDELLLEWEDRRAVFSPNSVIAERRVPARVARP